MIPLYLFSLAFIEWLIALLLLAVMWPTLLLVALAVRSDIHAVGRLLRRTGLDQLPGLWTVARGEIRLREWVKLLERR